MLNLRLEIDVVAEWLKAPELTLNTNKTKYVIFGSKNKTAACGYSNLKIEGKVLK